MFTQILKNYWLLFLIFQFPLLCFEGMYFIPMKKREHFALRLVLSCLVTEAMMLLPAYFFYQFYVMERTPYGNIIVFLPMFLFTLIPPFVCLKEKPSTIFYFAVISYTFQHLVSNIFNIVNFFLSKADIYVPQHYSYYTLMGDAVLIPLFFFLFIYKRNRSSAKIVTPAVLTFAICIIVFAFVLSNLSSYYLSDSNIALLFIRGYDSLACIVVVIVHLGLLEKNRYKEESEIIQQLWNEDRKNMKQLEENVNIINLNAMT